MQIKINNNILYDSSRSLENYISEFNILSKESDNLIKLVNVTSLLSDIKTTESFGYISTENVAKNIVDAAKAIWQKIIDFIKKMINYITSIVQGAIIKQRVNKLLEKIDSASIFAASADFQIDWPIQTIDEINAYTNTVKKYLPIIKSANNSDEFKELYMTSNKLSNNAFTSTITIDEAFKRIGIKAFKGGTFGGDGINRSFSKEIHDYMMKLRDGSSVYLMQLKQAGDLSKVCLKESLDLARENKDVKKANAMQAAINVINKASRMYIKYISAVLTIVQNVYTVQCFAQPGTPAYEEWLAKQKRNRTILIIAGVSAAVAAGGAALAVANPAAAAALGNALTGTAAKNTVKQLGTNAARTSMHTATSNVSRKLTNQIMDQVYEG